MRKRPTVIDFFCGAGGFSEGFRQQGFEIIAGYDKWKPAIDTYNFNFGEGKGIVKDLLKLGRSLKAIEALPDSQVILGSPPCVSFSTSNHSGKADKSMGKRLTTIFLKIVAIKKHKKGSILEAWFMENVVQSIDHVSKNYTFAQLGLRRWAEKNGFDPKRVAISLKDNHAVVNAADHGCPQQRIRAVAGEIISKGRLIIPKTHYADGDGLQRYLTLGQIKGALPAPNGERSERSICDPLYEHLTIRLDELTDHFYDTGLYRTEWMNSKFLKTNHPFMGKMSFPEKEDKPSRTITATKIGTSREAIIYRSEYGRIGHGEFRVPTVRESATLMGFPINYQFIGGEYAKYTLVGNAVSPIVSRVFAATLRTAMGLSKVRQPITRAKVDTHTVPNLNNFKAKEFNSPPKKKQRATFRRHPFKDGNITVTLSNYDIIKDQHKKKKRTSRWITSVQYGNGEGFPCQRYKDHYYQEIEGLVKSIEHGERFVETINNGFSETIAQGGLLQKLHEAQQGQDGYVTPAELLERVTELVDAISFTEKDIQFDDQRVFQKEVVPKKQVFALYAINKICTVANERP
jgi:DNA (cytosine-5)-methyltransferase 1